MKRSQYARKVFPIDIREQDPLKQGLKPHDTDSVTPSIFIREQDPLKQGLKLRSLTLSYRLPGRIREQDPLKQGLKLNS